jgi:tetratricopeptide (TPR) repeat protein
LLADAGACYIKLKDFTNAEAVLEKSAEINSKNNKCWNDLGLVYLNQKKYGPAIDALEKVRLLAPDNFLVCNNLAFAQSMLGNYEAAIESYLLYLKYYPENSKAWLNLAKLFEKTKKYAQAKEVFETFIQIDSNFHEEIAIKIADLEAELGENQKAFDKLVALFDKTGNNKLCSKIAKVCLSLHDTEGAKVWLERTLADNPEDMSSLQEMLKIFIDENNFENAITVNQKILKLNLSENNRLASLNNLAGLFLKSGKAEAAIDILNDLTEKDPENFSAWFNMGLARIDISEYHSAISAFEKAQELNPESAKTLYQLGICYLKIKSEDKAREYFEKIMKSEPDSYLPYYGLSLVFEVEKNYNKAIKILSKAIEMTEVEPEVYQQLARTYLNTGMEKKALEVLEKALNITPDNTGLLKEAAKLKFEQEDYQGALIIFRKLSGKISRGEETFTLTGICLFHLKEYDQAFADLSEALKINPKNVEAMLHLGLVYSYLGNQAKSIEMAQDALVLNPGNIRCLEILAQIFENNRRYEDAIWSYQKIIAIMPDHFSAFKKIGDCYFKLHNFSMCIKSYKIALDINPTDYEILINIGIAYQEINEFVKAIETFENYQSKNPSDTKILAIIGNAYFIREDYKKATDFLERYFLAGISPEPVYLLIAGDIYNHLNMTERAVNYYERALEIAPKSFDGLFKLGNILYEHGKHDEALEVFRTLLEFYPEDYQAKVLYSVTSYALSSFTEKEKKLYLSAIDKENRFFDQDWLLKEKHWCKALIFKTREVLKYLE